MQSPTFVVYHDNMDNNNVRTTKVTPEQLNLYLQTTRVPDRPHVCRTVACDDGFTMSVQASSGHYCSPRSDSGPWTSVEIGFPSNIEPLLFDYAEDPGNWTGTVYGYVPIELAAAVVELHGGFASPR